MKTGFRTNRMRAHRNVMPNGISLTMYGIVALAVMGGGAQAQGSRARSGPQGGGTQGSPLGGQGSRPASNGSYQAQVGRYNVTVYPQNGGRGNVTPGFNGGGYTPNRSGVGAFGNNYNGAGYGYNGRGYSGSGYGGFSYGPGYNNGGYTYPNNSASFNRFNRSSEGNTYPYRNPQQYTNDVTRVGQYVPGGIRSEDYLRGTQFRYVNGLYGRSVFRTYNGFGGYFPGSCAYYPYYTATYSPYGSFYSPYSAYYGAFPPYISSDYVSYTPPEVIYVPYPVYAGDNFSGYRSAEPTDDYYLNRRRNAGDSDYEVGENGAVKPDSKPTTGAGAETSQPTETRQVVASALADIRHAWQERDIQDIAKHTRRDTKIAVYLRGKYQYSLSASDYLDLTRDAFRATTTVSFVLDKAQRRENGVYAVTGRHIYKDKKGEQKTVFVSYVLEKVNGEYVITQIGTAPQKVEAEDRVIPQDSAPDSNDQ